MVQADPDTPAEGRDMTTEGTDMTTEATDMTTLRPVSPPADRYRRLRLLEKTGMTFRWPPRGVHLVELLIADGDNLQAAAGRLREMIESFDRLDERVAEIQRLEKRGDVIDREITELLDAEFITQFDRKDVRELTGHLDDVVDRIQTTAETLVVYGIAEPSDEARGLAQILSRQADSLVSALRKLAELKNLDADVGRVYDLERQADTLSRAAVARLFRDGMEALEVIKWRDLYHELENAIDSAEDAAEAIEWMFQKAT